MGRKNKKKNQQSTVPQSALAHELWGIVFLGFGFLLLISLVSHFVHKNNILGPIIGSKLSTGLVFLFGSIPSFSFPSVVIVIGIIMLKGNTLPLREIIYSGLMVLEICTLLAIHNLPIIRNENFTFVENSIGNTVTYMYSFIFGKQTFGPYFITSFALLISSILLFRLNIVTTINGIGTFFQRIWIQSSLRITKILAESRQNREKKKLVKSQAPQTKQTSLFKNEANSTVMQKTVREKKVADKQLEQPAQKEQQSSEEKNELERQLAAFRAKKSEPVKILTPEAIEKQIKERINDEMDLENEDEVDDHGIDEAAVLDPSLVDSESDEEFCKIPSMSKPQKKPAATKPYKVPAADILPDPPISASIIDRSILEENARTLEKTLLNFGVEGKVINISPGPVVTQYEIELAPGVKISKVVNLIDDLSLAVGGKKIRIEAPIPGKAAVGIELPNEEMHTVYFKHILTSDVFRKSKAKLPIIIGKNISGIPFISDITRMPHLLIAGQTGSGKSVAINSFLCTLLMTKKPDELRLILIDPKKVEMSYYEHIPHLLAPVVTESKEAVKALHWSVVEMTRRYRLLAKVHARNIDSFNHKIEEKSINPATISQGDNKKLPYIVIIVDELADLMLTASRDVEGLIQRIAQLARAVGIHLVVATQRPSVDIITGPIKANLTSRIAFRTIQSVDSRTILGSIGAEKLLGRGDMLFLRNGAPDIERYHGSFISEEDVETIVDAIRKQSYETEKIESFEEVMSGTKETIPGVADSSSSNSNDERDEKFEEAARLIVTTGLGSTSLLQRRLKLGYARAGRLMDELHDAGIVGPQEGSKVREVLVRPEDLEEMLNVQ